MKRTFVANEDIKVRNYRPYTRRDIDSIPQLQILGRDFLHEMKAVSAVLPFRVNNYVVEELIDWQNIPDDPIFQLTFPQPEMLEPHDLEEMLDLVRSEAPAAEVQATARRIQRRLNPHPAGQQEYNVPRIDGEPMPGMQHKYRETVLFFPSQGQTCHSYCTYCFRWAQFVGIDELKFANREGSLLVRYLKQHPEVTDVLFTGGDPLIMKSKILRRYIEPLLEVDTVRTIRIGSKAPAYWPQRFLADSDSDDLLALFEQVIDRGKHLAIMAHYSHPRELSTRTAELAVRRLTTSGAVVRCQAPLIQHVNDNSEVWAEMWRRQVQVGAVPYYLFVERDTGPKRYFEVPLSRALKIYNRAYRQVAGTARTVRGPSMSASPGKVLVDGVAEIAGEKVFVLKFLQARDPGWVGKPFFARYDRRATWLGQLAPAFGRHEFFYEQGLRDFEETKRPFWEARPPASTEREALVFGD